MAELNMKSEIICIKFGRIRYSWKSDPWADIISTLIIYMNEFMHNLENIGLYLYPGPIYA